MNLNFRGIFSALNEAGVRWLLVGGMNVFLQHGEYLTQDVDVYVDDSSSNLTAVNRALQKMKATWGPTETTWGPVPDDPKWLLRQRVVCVITEHGFLDVFTKLPGINESFQSVWDRAFAGTISTVSFRGLNDADMLACQLALPEPEQKLDRIRLLQRALASRVK